MRMWDPLGNVPEWWGETLARDDWEWEVMSSELQHTDRVPLMRTIPFAESAQLGEGILEEGVLSEIAIREGGGKALSLNISSGGMLLLMNRSPEVDSVLRVEVPTPVSRAHTPTLVEVRWIRPLRHLLAEPLYFVGVKFLF